MSEFRKERREERGADAGFGWMGRRITRGKEGRGGEGGKHEKYFFGA